MNVYECNLYVYRAKLRYSNKKQKNLFRKGVKKMKKFTKLFLSSALVAAMAMSSMVAFADWEAPASYDIKGGEITGTYNPTTGEVNITDFKGTDTVAADTQATFLVVKGDNTVAATQDNVVGIDQEANGAFTKKGIKDKPTVTEDMTAVTYSVYVGYYNASNTFTVKKGTFVVNDGAAPSVLWGQVTLGANGEPDDAVDTNDSVLVLGYYVGTVEELTEAQLANANVTGHEDATAIDTNDSVDILGYYVGVEGTKTEVLRLRDGLDQPVE